MQGQLQHERQTNVKKL
jgi:chromosome segregation ATPase